MKNELYYSTGYTYPEPSSPYAFIKNIKFLLLLTLTTLGAIAYFNMEVIHQFINSMKNDNKQVIVTHESYTQPKEQNQSIKKEDKFTEKELEHIANEIVKSLKSIEAEKKSLKVESIKTIHYEEAEQAIHTINKTEEVKIEEIKKVETSTIEPPKIIKTTKLSPIAKPSIKPQAKIEKETKIKPEPEAEAETFYYDESETPVVEEEAIEMNYLPPKDILETLSMELNNAIELPREETQEAIPFIEGDITYIEGEIIEDETEGESLY